MVRLWNALIGCAAWELVLLRPLATSEGDGPAGRGAFEERNICAAPKNVVPLSTWCGEVECDAPSKTPPARALPLLQAASYTCTEYLV